MVSTDATDENNFLGLLRAVPPRACITAVKSNRKNSTLMTVASLAVPNQYWDHASWCDRVACSLYHGPTADQVLSIMQVTEFTAGWGLERLRVYCIARLEGLLGIVWGMTPRRRGVTDLPTHPLRHCAYNPSWKEHYLSRKRVPKASVCSKYCLRRI